MSTIFSSYERDYSELSTNLSQKSASAALLTGEQKKRKLSDLKAGLDEAQTLIQKMDLEARSLGQAQRSFCLAKLREYKSDLTKLKKEVERCETSRDELLGYGDPATTSTDQKGRLLVSTDRLNRSGERIKESKRISLETEELGASILRDLHEQREKFLHSRDTLYGVDDNIGKSRKILGKGF